MIQVRKPKLILDPILGVIEVTEILPLIDVKEFQLLGFKHQLGLNSMIFPAATHTRKQHSLGAYKRTRRLARDWLDYGFINQEEAKALQVYALYHDIGHGPFSHVTESLGKVDHDKRGLQMVENLKEKIESVGCNYNLVHDFFSRKNKLYLAVFDKNLGMEKLDYLERDSFYTIGERPGVEYLAKHIYFIDSDVVIDEVAIDSAKAIQDFYIKMSKNVYLRKKSSILQRLIEKMTILLMADGLTEEELFGLTDFGLLGRFETSSNKLLRFYHQNFIHGVFPKLALEFKYSSRATEGDLSYKSLKVMGLKDEVLDKLLSSSHITDFKSLEALEKNLAKLANIPEEALIVIPPFSKERFDPQDIKVYSREGRTRMLSEIYPNHFQAMKEYGRSHLSLKICVLEKYRKALYDQAEKVRDYLIELITS
ncbi:MAG: HD domain-containing protein [Patescibacteria group bacterium]